MRNFHQSVPMQIKQLLGNFASYSSLVITVNHNCFVYKQKAKILQVFTKLLIARMRNFQDTFQSLKRLFIYSFNVHDCTFKRSFIRNNPLTWKLREQSFRGVLFGRCSSILQINHTNLPYETPFLRAHLYGSFRTFQIRSKLTTRRKQKTLSF